MGEAAQHQKAGNMIEQYHDFFIMVGGGAAALAGLVFVALSVNVRAVVQDSTHHNRAIGTLAGFTAAFITCALGLLAQSDVAFGVEWLIVALIAGYIYVRGYIQARHEGGSRSTLSTARTIAGTACYAVQILGSILLILGNPLGIYAASIAMVVFFALMISGAWLLIVGVHGNVQK
jgi:hypothetical protein